MDHPNWVDILEYMYYNQKEELKVSVSGTGRLSVSPHSDLVQELDLEEGEARDALEYMISAGLVSPDRGGSILKLTPKGFEVAHENRIQEQKKKQEDQRVERREKREDERSKRQHEVNRAVAMLTLGLMLVTVIDSAVRTFVGKGSYNGAFLTVVVGLATVVLFSWILDYYGLLSAVPGN